ncbi:MAG TPA: hypothetical protein VK666_11210 [Chryseolinea sp.]|nr:hypothetical protein [Chryseolinea sp.]
MFVPFESLPDRARLWVYQSNRKFTSAETDIISETLSAFSNSWNAHGVPLLASFEIRMEQFIILAVDEASNSASGCSIDDSVRTIKSLGDTLGIDLFDRSLIAFNKQGEDVLTIPLGQLKTAYENGIWNHESVFINNLVANKKEMQNNFLVPAASTWLKRYLPHQKIAH